MKPVYSSVTQFFADLRAHLLSAGMPVVRTVAADTDLVFDTGSGFFRLVRELAFGVASIGWAFGTDPDVLSVATMDPERQMPFTVSEGAEFDPTFVWENDTKQLRLCIFALGGGTHHGSCYRIDIDLKTGESYVLHENRFRPQYEPNFKDKGGPYIPAGA